MNLNNYPVMRAHDEKTGVTTILSKTALKSIDRKIRKWERVTECLNRLGIRAEDVTLVWDTTPRTIDPWPLRIVPGSKVTVMVDEAGEPKRLIEDM